MKLNSLKSEIKGFTLIEILIVVGIIALLSAVVGVNALESGKKSRDAKRQADLSALQNSIELYKNKNGRYPEACNGADAWSGQQGTSYTCSGTNTQYITGLAPEFISVLPLEKKLNGTNSGYIYRVNSAGTSYKVKAHRTVESEIVEYTHEFRPCDIRVASDPGTGSLQSGSTDPEVIGWCGRVQHSGSSLPSECRYTNEDWRISYGVWGGISPLFPTTLINLTGLTNNQKVSAIRNTTTVICR